MKSLRGTIFSGVNANIIRVIREIALDEGFGHVTSHGFRRGRTTDVVRGLDLKDNPAASLAEVCESGGWRQNSN